MKYLILDCGGVLVYPRTGDWAVPIGMTAILGERARDIHTARYIRAMDVRMDWHMTADEIERLADDFTNNIDRYGFFDDVKPWLTAWKARGLSLGILSDAMPSIKVFLKQYGILDDFDAAVISTEVGAIKPDPKMYAAILEALGAEPSDCLFADDKPENLEGALAAGMKAVQMARAETLPHVLWDGPVARDFAELDAFVRA